MTAPTPAGDPHADLPIRSAGVPLGQAEAAMVMIHGRGATAESILSLVPALAAPRMAFLAPQAADNTWYPYSFLAPIARNEPGITSGLQAIQRVLNLIEASGIPRTRSLLLGFSQGACLASEYAARYATRYGGLAILSGGLIGPEGTPRDYTGSLDGTPVFVGCSDVDSHIPAERVRESATTLERLGGRVILRLYPGMGHIVNEDELNEVRTMISGVFVS